MRALPSDGIHPGEAAAGVCPWRLRPNRGGLVTLRVDAQPFPERTMVRPCGDERRPWRTALAAEYFCIEPPESGIDGKPMPSTLKA